MLTATDKLSIWLTTGFMAILTIFFNMYLLLVNQRNYKKNHKLNPADTIITAISLASILQQILAYLWQSMDVMDLECRVMLAEATLLVLVFSVKLIIFWSTAFLTFYYGTKLVVEPVHCYTRIQDIILRHVLTVLAIIVLSGLANCLPLLTVLTNHNSTSEVGDCGSIMPDDTAGLAYIIYYILISDIIPGILMIKSSISISYHLAKHLQHMKATTNGFHGPKLGSQMRVIKMTLSLVAVFVSFVAVDLYTQVTVVLLRANTITLTILFASIYTTISAFVLVYGKKSYWKELISSYNLFLDEYPFLSKIKVTEIKSEPQDHSHAH